MSTGLAQALAEASVPALHHPASAQAGDGPDAPVSEPGQVLSGQPARCCMVRPDRGDAAAVDVMHADCRQPAAQGDPQPRVLLEAGRDHQDPADALLLHLPDGQRGVIAVLVR